MTAARRPSPTPMSARPRATPDPSRLPLPYPRTQPAPPSKLRRTPLGAIGVLAAALLALLVAATSSASAATPSAGGHKNPIGSILSHLRGSSSSSSPTYTFDDEFNGSAGSAPSALWDYQTGGNGWGNNELEQYTARRVNSQLDGNGDLAIIARKETYRGSDGITRNFTSARLYSAKPVQFGYVEARIKLPQGAGLWPAFWMMGGDAYQVGWPQCGEIDAMEALNSMPTAYGTVHGPDYATKTEYTYGSDTSPTGGLGTAWHTFAVSKTSTAITWYLDGAPYYTLHKSDLKTGQTWTYDQPQYLLLNVAVGGWAGPPTSATPASAAMFVDWVRAGSAAAPPDATS